MGVILAASTQPAGRLAWVAVMPQVAIGAANLTDLQRFALDRLQRFADIGRPSVRDNAQGSEFLFDLQHLGASRQYRQRGSAWKVASADIKMGNQIDLPCSLNSSTPSRAAGC